MSPTAQKDFTATGPININLRSGHFVPPDPKMLTKSLQSLEQNMLDSGDENNVASHARPLINIHSGRMQIGNPNIM